MLRDRLQQRRHDVGREEHAREEELRQGDEVRDGRHLVDGLGPARQREPHREERDRPQRREHEQVEHAPDDLDLEDEQGDSEQDENLDHGEDEPQEHLRGEEADRPEGRRHDPAEHPALLVRDQRERDREDRQLHDVHPEDARHQEVDVAQAHGRHLLLRQLDDRRGARHRERGLSDQLLEDRPAHRDLLGSSVVRVHEQGRDARARLRGREAEVGRDGHDHVSLAA